MAVDGSMKKRVEEGAGNSQQINRDLFSSYLICFLYHSFPACLAYQPYQIVWHNMPMTSYLPASILLVNGVQPSNINAHLVLQYIYI